MIWNDHEIIQIYFHGISLPCKKKEAGKWMSVEPNICKLWTWMDNEPCNVLENLMKLNTRMVLADEQQKHFRFETWENV